ncbi:hypothetical protein vseg_011282 [Gypsophila vaccaria]
MCEKCEKSLTKVIFRKIGANNTNESADDTIWKCQMHNMQAASNTIMNAKFCRTCAYGVCAMCGKQVLDTKLYKQMNV